MCSPQHFRLSLDMIQGSVDKFMMLISWQVCDILLFQGMHLQGTS